MIYNRYLPQSITLLLLTTAYPLPIPDDESQAPPQLGVDANIDFAAYPDFQSLRPCLQNYFGGPGGRGGADNPVAINVQCMANSCLCTPENIEENLLHISSQVEKDRKSVV